MREVSQCTLEFGPIFFSRKYHEITTRTNKTLSHNRQLLGRHVLMDPNPQEIANSLITLALRSIWLERDARVFENTPSHSARLVDLIVDEWQLWQVCTWALESCRLVSWFCVVSVVYVPFVRHVKCFPLSFFRI
jgi:hypothetical protein